MYANTTVKSSEIEHPADQPIWSLFIVFIAMGNSGSRKSIHIWRFNCIPNNKIYKICIIELKHRSSQTEIFFTKLVKMLFSL